MSESWRTMGKGGIGKGDRTKERQTGGGDNDVLSRLGPGR